MAKKKSKATNTASASKPAAKSKAKSGDGSDAGAAGGDYVVLARKYRPQSFDDLIGQQAMVTTLANAFATDRIAQGFMLTGVRGVGKTTTARILARALNYEMPRSREHDEIDRPTINMPALGVHCAQIMESRHCDVLEMDAASNTGIDNIREIIESARYKPMLARYKVYIIDEVHMLSKGAFNAMLKTLEEPPPHVKFIFATTEIRKVPVTVLSRCQRFDLRRVDVPALAAHFQMICDKEGAGADAEALALIARAAEGSVRDGLSILDQAIATSLSGSGGSGAENGAVGDRGGKITAGTVALMLGLADRGRIFDLADHLFAGEAGEALQALADLHHDGAEALQVLSDLLEAVHVTARLKTTGLEAATEALSAEEKRRAGALAEKLSMALLSRAWQMLLKGLEEVGKAPNPLAAAEMVLIRLAYTADLPAPDEIIKMLGSGAATAGKSAAGGSASPAPQGALQSATTARPGARQAPDHHRPPPPPPWDRDGDGDGDGKSADAAKSAAPSGSQRLTASEGLAPMPQSFAAVVALAGAHREAKLCYDLEENVSLVRFELGKIDLYLLPDAPKELANELREKLNRWTGANWILALSNHMGEIPLAQVQRDRKTRDIDALRDHPAVKAVLEEFPEAEIEDVRPLEIPAKHRNGNAGG